MSEPGLGVQALLAEVASRYAVCLRLLDNVEADLGMTTGPKRCFRQPV